MPPNVVGSGSLEDGVLFPKLGERLLKMLDVVPAGFEGGDRGRVLNVAGSISVFDGAERLGQVVFAE